MSVKLLTEHHLELMPRLEITCHGSFCFSVSRKPSICSASLPHATLEAGCLEYARNTICEYTCDEGYRMSDIADVRYGHRKEEGIQEKYVYCLLGTWATYNNNHGLGFIDICLPECTYTMTFKNSK